MSLYQTLKDRGYIAQVTHEEEIQKALDDQKIHFYIGYDPTADSLHVGHFLTVMAARLLQQHGHTPVIVMGGGTGMIGDPTGRSDMRPVMTVETINHHVDKFKEQVSRFVSFEETQANKAIMVDNAQWLRDLNYMNFLRDYGTLFSVNRMLSADTYKTKFEHGLTFLEFNYMIMQAYDYLELHNRYGTTLQIGGRDQWSNIIAGVDLIRRVKSADTFGMTLNLLEKADGTKMGKTAGGALWLDKDKTSPYEFYQYFRNVDDASVVSCLKLLTELPLEEINQMAELKGKAINEAKETLAYHVTALVHGTEEAAQAQEAARSLFSTQSTAASAIPTATISEQDLDQGIDILSLLTTINIASSKAEGRRLVTQGGIKVNDHKVEDPQMVLNRTQLQDGHIMIQKGKKVFCKVIVS